MYNVVPASTCSCNQFLNVQVCLILIMYFCGLYRLFHVSPRQIPPMTNVMTKYQEGEFEGKQGDERTSRGYSERATPPPPWHDMTLNVKWRPWTLTTWPQAKGRDGDSASLPAHKHNLQFLGSQRRCWYRWLWKSEVSDFGIRLITQNELWVLFFINEKPATSVGKYILELLILENCIQKSHL